MRRGREGAHTTACIEKIDSVEADLRGSPLSPWPAGALRAVFTRSSQALHTRSAFRPASFRRSSRPQSPAMRASRTTSTINAVLHKSAPRAAQPRRPKPTPPAWRPARFFVLAAAHLAAGVRGRRIRDSRCWSWSRRASAEGHDHLQRRSCCAVGAGIREWPAAGDPSIIKAAAGADVLASRRSVVKYRADPASAGRRAPRARRRDPRAQPLSE